MRTIFLNRTNQVRVLFRAFVNFVQREKSGTPDPSGLSFVATPLDLLHEKMESTTVLIVTQSTKHAANGPTPSGQFTPLVVMPLCDFPNMQCSHRPGHGCLSVAPQFMCHLQLTSVLVESTFEFNNKDTKTSRHPINSLQVDICPHRQRSWQLLNLIIHFFGTKAFSHVVSTSVSLEDQVRLTATMLDPQSVGTLACNESDETL